MGGLGVWGRLGGLGQGLGLGVDGVWFLMVLKGLKGTEGLIVGYGVLRGIL